MHATPLPILAITMGDVNGIGPEILVKALAQPEPWQYCRPVVLGDLKAYERARERFAPDAPQGDAVDKAVPLPDRTRVAVWNAGADAPDLQPGMLDPAAGACAVTWIEETVRLCQAGTVNGMVTCPINKECIRQSGCTFSGHTDLIAAMTESPDYRMCLFTDTMRIVHITAHLSLRDAIEAISVARIIRSVEIGHAALVKMGMKQPRIAVAGLNPHAGEAGAFGREEIAIIAPAVASCKAQGITCTGPYPPDTIFRRMRSGEFDMVIALYHDQGHIALKLIAMDEGVNVTLGIPIVRTSVDHGTAYDIAWNNEARSDSLCAAIRMAAQLTGHCSEGKSSL